MEIDRIVAKLSPKTPRIGTSTRPTCWWISAICNSPASVSATRGASQRELAEVVRQRRGERTPKLVSAAGASGGRAGGGGCRWSWRRMVVRERLTYAMGGERGAAGDRAVDGVGSKSRGTDDVTGDGAIRACITKFDSVERGTAPDQKDHSDKPSGRRHICQGLCRQRRRQLVSVAVSDFAIASRQRRTLSRMTSAVAFQTKALGLSFQVASHW